MARIEHECMLLRDDHAGQPQCHRFARLQPSRSSCTSRIGNRLIAPTNRWLSQVGNACIGHFDAEDRPIEFEHFPWSVDHDFKGGKGTRFGEIHRWHAGRIPTTAMDARALPTHGVVCPSRLDDSEKRGHLHEKTPCPMRPSRASTSRAPISVSAKSTGHSPPKANAGEQSQRCAGASPPRISAARLNRRA